ncbi:hypothetical protein [Paracoccus sp. TOH]|uniref:hypothetical protein n=1 Tax=Paracoccus sp. TOH TaxID=1263728 RepID=UPI0025B2735F|nr:hypothetical protein [Paracoccus sp. TOH]WJS87274.1 hypothetical protein NBE95_20560 [Paracoccus sp. TOH]
MEAIARDLTAAEARLCDPAPVPHSAPATITEARREFLVGEPNACIHWGQVTLTATPERDGVDRRFVLSGPSGRHTLLVIATDAARLDAHWRGFCADQRNFPINEAAWKLPDMGE